jgi:hypothetical protein
MAHGTRTADDTPISQLSGVLGSSIPQAIGNSAGPSLERIGRNPRKTERVEQIDDRLKLLKRYNITIRPHTYYNK